MPRLGRTNRQSGFRGAQSNGTGPTPQFERLLGPRPPRATTIVPLPLSDQRRIRILTNVRAHRLSWRWRFPLQGWDGSRQRESTGNGRPIPGFERLLGPQPPEVILPLPTQQQQTICRKLQAVRTSRRLRHPDGLIRLIAPASTAKVNIDAVTGTATPSGSVVESCSVLTLSQMTIVERLVAVRRARLLRALRYTSKLGQPGVSTTIYTDAVTGSASPSGSVVESTSTLSLQQMTVRRTLVAVTVGRLRRSIRYRSRLGRGPAITIYSDYVYGASVPPGTATDTLATTEVRWLVGTLQRRARGGHAITRGPAVVSATGGVGTATEQKVYTETLSGTAAPTGTLTDQKVYTDAPSGTAAPSGTVTEAISVLTLAQMTILVRLVARRVARLRRSIRTGGRLSTLAPTLIYTDTVTGAAQPSGSSIDQKVYTEAVTGSAASTGSVVEQTSTLTLEQMTVRVRLAALRIARLRRLIKYRSKLERGPAITVTSDAPTGAAAASGAVVEEKIGSDAVSGAATPSGAVSEAKVCVDSCTGVAAPAGTVTDARTGTDAVSGTASASGSSTGAQSGADAPTGAAAPSGSVVESYFRGYADSPTGTAAPAGSLADALTHAATVAGSSGAGGSASDIYTPPFVPGPVGGAGGADNSEPNWGPLITDRRSSRKVIVDKDGSARVVTRKKRKAEDEDELLILGLLE